MPKMKSHSGAKKRFKFTGTGKVRYKPAKMRHILTKKSATFKRQNRKILILNKADTVKVKRMLPTGTR
jgi:large subunit ribosomal protein L35